MHLSLHCREADWKAFLARLDCDTFLELVALARIEPWGEQREDMRWKLAAIMNGAAKDSDDPFRELDYLHLGPQEVPTVEDSMANVRAAFGGRPYDMRY